MDIDTPTSDLRFELRAPDGYELAAGEVHLWAAALPLAREDLAHCETLLASDERARAAIPPLEDERSRFVAVRGMLRHLLGGYVGVAPSTIAFEYGEQGKPALVGHEHRAIRFNVSHAGEVALLAFALDREVGVDVERVREVPRADRIAARVFAPEAAQRWRALPDQQRTERFMVEWTRLEALSKLSGEGVWRTVIGRDRLPRPNAECFELRPQPGYVATLAVKGEGARLRAWRYQVGSLSSSASNSSGGSGGAK